MEATTLKQLADLVGGELSGDPTTEITSAWPLDDASAGSITMIDHADRVSRLEGTVASAVLLPSDAPAIKIPAIRVLNVHEAFTAIVSHFRPPAATRFEGIHPSATVAESAMLGEGVSIGAGAVIGEYAQIGKRVTIGAQSVVDSHCQIDEDAWLAPRVTLYPYTLVGARSRLHSGSVIGADGFGYRQAEGRHVPVAQLGNVEIGADVEIGANTTIDGGVYGPTRIGEGTKIDNLVQIGHNCRLGRHNLICSQVGIAGSTSTGDYVVMAGQVGVRDHVHIGQGATLSAMAGVTNDVPEGAVMLGAPATPLRDQKLQMAAVAKLPQLRKEFRTLRREVSDLQKQSSGDLPASEDTSRAA